ncbi:DNA cytosine methyltransferase [Microvirga arsenatis]|uniref:DNA (cytosine-5-)-methyltransferase n=1 Tax=Microvirga arsenatis TaxID=2692265 RepID=A0ABW9YV45_9HYPH|nr:DNA cytosine methyltransferase [Microvirga arsenatis]NBJ10921.1 DNA (cytosine-5-)-methyltransferase [Microvirga arsenatis]NBJ24181.1 DNA (cytosine-5-)-methyltransferase [Microvirga arsenatis]
MAHQRTFYEFFAGGGMARAGLGKTWRCLFANDFDAKKSQTYQANWGGEELVTGDIRALTTADLPGEADLAWASFPCQDLSLAGAGAGLKGERSGTFYPFWDLMNGLIAEGRGPAVIALENVCGTLTSHQGKDFGAICSTYRAAGYRFGAVVIDAALFVPQSRPRLFVIGVRSDVSVPERVQSGKPSSLWHTRALQTAYNKLSPELQREWIWWRLPAPSARKTDFADVIEEHPNGVRWHTPEQTNALLAMMSSINLAKVEQAKRAGRRMVGGIYKRTRPNASGMKVQRAEVRFDDVSGCLRTPAGGSSRQLIIIVDGENVRTRLISPRETARLMGLDDKYKLPPNYNEAYHLTGDGVAVPVVRHLAKHLIEPILAGVREVSQAA